jgi:hypothetical protein
LIEADRLVAASCFVFQPVFVLLLLILKNIHWCYCFLLA